MPQSIPDHPEHQDMFELRAKLEDALQQVNDGCDSSHDVHHARRVCSYAFAISREAGEGDQRTLIAAAYLHDLINVPKNSPDRAGASRLSAQAAAPILQKLGFDEAEISAIAHCIEAHSFSAAIKPESINAKILQDADRLESVGALGIARTFYIAGKMDSNLFHGEDPFASDRPLDDKQYAIDHFKVKLLGLADTMQTEAGRQIALKRTADMRLFLGMLADELDVPQPW